MKGNKGIRLSTGLLPALARSAVLWAGVLPAVVSPNPLPLSDFVRSFFSPRSGAALEQANGQDLSGTFEVLWGDPPPGSNRAAQTSYWLRDKQGNAYRLQLDPLADPGRWLPLNGQVVALKARPVGPLVPAREGAADPVLRVDAVTALSPQTPTAPALTGSQPWVSVLCQFSDVAAQPKDLTYFLNMFAGAAPSLDHYWRELSYDKINMTGSGAFGWYVLPKPRSYYVYDMNGDGKAEANLDRAANDCTAVADPYVHFPSYVGINLMFNSELDGLAWGGSRTVNVDSQVRSFRMTWEPPWGYEHISAMAHEMGHGFGLPHSSGQYGQTYDNDWDVMSWPWLCNPRHPVYGCTGQHTISPYKNSLGWFDAGQVFYAPKGRSTITLDRLDLSAAAHYRMAIIPLADESYYSVEARRRSAGSYDAQLPGDAVIIHRVDSGRAYVLDVDNNGKTGDAGAMWTAGETFVDPVNPVEIRVDSETATGYVVTIHVIVPPSSFRKSAPASGTAGAARTPTISWEAGSGATSYEYCFDTTNDSACAGSWMSAGSATNATLSGLTPGAVYYWQVRAVNTAGKAEADDGAWWSFKAAFQGLLPLVLAQ